MPDEQPTTHTVAITGATGLIGTALVAHLRMAGHIVRRLVRGAAKESGDISWNPASGQLEPAALEGCTAVINLAGEPIAQRWTREHKQAIVDSRLKATSLLAKTITAMAAKPQVMLSGSAIGIYGDRGDETVDERSSPGTDFLAEVAQKWEASAEPAAAAGVRVAWLRTGIVLSPHGGALEKMLTPFKLGLGGPMGGGRQWISWITLDDQVRAMTHLLTSGTRGPVNLVAPTPVTNAQFAEVLGEVLHRPAMLPVPRFALELMFGEMADGTILAGQRVRPRVLQESGFRFGHAELSEALRAMLSDHAA